MRAIDAAREKLKPPSSAHEAYKVSKWSRDRGSAMNPTEPLTTDELPLCVLCKDPVHYGLEVAYRKKPTSYTERVFVYVHTTCLKPIKTFFNGA